MPINDKPQLRDGQGNLVVQQRWNPGSDQFEAIPLNSYARTAVAVKPKGNTFSANMGYATQMSCSLKMDLEADFYAVRVVKYSTQLLPAPNWRILVAATETADTSTAANQWTPVVGGTSYNSIRSATADYGWNQVTFNGKFPLTDTPAAGVLAGRAYTIVSNVVTVDVPAQDPVPAVGSLVTVYDAAAGGIPKNQYTVAAGTTATAIKFALTHADASGTCAIMVGSPFANPGIAVSDLIACPSVPRADGGTRPLILVRSSFDGSQGVPGDWYNISASDNVATARNRGRINQLGGNVSADAVSVLTNGFSTSQNYIHPLFVIPYFTKAVRSVAVVGDSTHEATALSTDKASSWLSRACYDVSTVERPVVPYNVAMGSGSSTNFIGFAKHMFSVAAPDVVFYQPYTVNDYGSAPTLRLFYDAWARAVEFIDWCAARRITVILTTPIINENYTLASDNIRKQGRSMVIDLAKAKSLLYVDFSALLGDGASPEKFKPEYKDTIIHQNDAALDPMAAVCSLALKAVL